jgi:hypothetical protein
LGIQDWFSMRKARKEGKDIGRGREERRKEGKKAGN